MKNSLYLFATLLLVTTACGDSSDPADPPELLFVQNSDGALLTDSTLTLTGVSPQTGWFTDRPNRASGQIPTEDFVLAWGDGEDSFADDPPNADFSCQVDEETVNYVLELMAPSLEGTDLTYAVESVGDQALPTSLQCDSDAHLFIDSGVCEEPPGKDCKNLSVECWVYLECLCFSADTSDVANDSDKVLIGSNNTDMTGHCRYRRCKAAGGTQQECAKSLPPIPSE